MNTEKPWCGSRKFGMAFYDSQSQVGRAHGSCGRVAVSPRSDHLRMACDGCVVPTLWCQHVPATRAWYAAPARCLCCTRPCITAVEPAHPPQALAAIGTLLEITDHANLEDGRILVNNIGRQRFKIVEVSHAGVGQHRLS